MGLKQFNQFCKILVAAPHTDDGEFGCGATLAKFISQGSEVHYVAFSSAEESVPKEYPRDILRHEVISATSKLGIDRNNVRVLNYPVRRFSEYRQDILEDLVLLNNELKPDLIFIPSTHDIHQDHAVISQEVIRAFKNRTILGYEIVWNNLKFENQCIIHVTLDQLESKIAAMNCYESQKHRHYMKEEFIQSLARVRGAQVAGTYAELFEVIRWVID